MAGNAPPNLNMSPRGGGARWAVAAPGRAAVAGGARGLPEGRAGRWHQARGVRCPGTRRVRSCAQANFGFPTVGESVAGAGGRAVSCPARRLPPRPPASCGGRGRHVVVGLRRRRGARAAVTGCATGSPSAAWRRTGRRRRLPSKVSRRPPAPALPVPKGTGSRCDVREARRGRQVGEAAGWGCGRARGRCGRCRARRGEARRAGLGGGWAPPPPRTGPREPELGPWRAWRRRAETCGPGSCPSAGARADAGGPGRPFPCGRPPAPQPLLAGTDAAQGGGWRGPSLSGCRQKGALRGTRTLSRGYPPLFPRRVGIPR